MWRTGGDLSASSYAMWLDRLDLATDARMRPFVGPGAIANPDFLEVGYSPRQPKGAHGVQTALEQRSMFTMWSALPGPLILSADLRPAAPSGGIDAEALETLTNPEVIAVNQDEAALPMRPVVNTSDSSSQTPPRLSKTVAPSSAALLAAAWEGRGGLTNAVLDDSIRQVRPTSDSNGSCESVTAF